MLICCTAAWLIFTAFFAHSYFHLLVWLHSIVTDHNFDRSRSSCLDFNTVTKIFLLSLGLHYQTPALGQESARKAVTALKTNIAASSSHAQRQAKTAPNVGILMPSLSNHQCWCNKKGPDNRHLLSIVSLSTFPPCFPLASPAMLLNWPLSFSKNQTVSKIRFSSSARFAGRA
jgi:hypothetical protein